MKRLWVFRVWHVPVSVLLAAVVSVMINLATDEFSWALTSGLVTLVLAQAGLAMWQAVEDQRDRRDARNRLLKPLRMPPHALPKFGALPAGRRTEDSVLGAAAVALWLTASASPTPLWGRSSVRDRLVAWCADRDPQAGAVRVVTGPAGVGKSRLARAVAESLPAGWAAGRLNGGVEVLIDRIAAAGEPTLVVVDDADRVPDLDVLISRAVHHPTLVRLLVLTRTPTSLRLLPDTVLAELTRVEVLGPVGEAADRQRWFAEAARAYARELRKPAPDLPDRPIGTDKDTPLVLHARALLAVLGRSGIRTWSLRDLVTELVTLEQSTWQADLPRLPGGLRGEGLGVRAIVAELGLAKGTVRRFVRATSVDELLTNDGTGRRPSLLEEFKPYLQQRWTAGCTNATLLFEEIKARGYRGRYQIVRDYLRPFRAGASVPEPVPPAPKVRRVVAWIMSNPENMTGDDQGRLDEILARSPELTALTGHVRSFATMMRDLRGERLQEWMAAADADGLPALHSFVIGLRRDQDAVTAGLTLPWNSGPVEGHVNRIKMIKRQMYGRANPDLLRKRILLAD